VRKAAIFIDGLASGDWSCNREIMPSH